MTTEQQFFQNIVHSNAITYQALEEIVGDMNKNIGLSANFFELASEVVGSTITENYDLASLFGNYQDQISSNNTDFLKQSLQNVNSGIANTIAYPDYDVCTHISTTLSNYNIGMSSTFLSGQLFTVSSLGIGNNSVVSVPLSVLGITGNQFNSHIIDVPTDMAVFGFDGFNTYGDFNGVNLVNFDYSWSYAGQVTNLIIKFNYSVSYFIGYTFGIYWGSNDSNFISTNYNISGNTKYVGTQGFVNNVGALTTSVFSKGVTFTSGRKNFWSNTIPYSLGYTSNAFVDGSPYLWAPDRINATIFDGTPSQQDQPLRYPILNSVSLDTYISGNTTYKYLYGQLVTSGTGQNQGLNATLNANTLFESPSPQLVNLSLIERFYQNNVPQNLIILQSNPKKSYLNGNPIVYSVVYNNQIVPSAFTKVIQDPYIWRYFAENLVPAKVYFLALNDVVNVYLNTLDNFVADFFFGVTFNNVKDYFIGDNLVISRNTLKDFTQPYGSTNTPPLNFSEFEEKSIFQATNIVSSKEYLIFNQGVLNLTNEYKVPVNTGFEIYKPISLVCNGIDPYDQGTGLAFDYTLNLTFQYENQNYLNKILYLMASKYVLSKSDYQTRIDLNQDTYGYYYLVDQNTTDYNEYSVSSIDEFRLFGYSGIIPDLKDGVVRPILNRAFSPVDTKKYTYEEFVALLRSRGITNQDDINDAVQEYLDAGNSFYTVNLDVHPSEYVYLQDISVCAANYILNEAKYWNVDFSNPYNRPPTALGEESGFTQLTAQINSGIVTSITSLPPYTIQNVQVGNNCFVKSVYVNSLGSMQSPGTYTSWVLPPINSRTNEQPVQIKYEILSSGIINPATIEILNSGSNFYFNFDAFLTDVPFTTTGMGETNANVTFIMNNVSTFKAVTDASYNLVSFTQSSPPAEGYNAGFKFNNKAFVGLGYSSTADVDILINNYPTVDSFFIAGDNLQPGDLENLNNFQNPDTALSALNFTAGSQNYVMYEDEIFNKLYVPSTYGNQNLSYVTIKCKLIELNNSNPSGYITAHIYADDGTQKTEVASSDRVFTTELNRFSYADINIPLSFTFTNNVQTLDTANYWVSIKQNLTGCFLSLQGAFSGITTSNYTISSSQIYNDNNNIIVFGGISTSGYDLDLSKTTIGISSVFGSNVLASETNSVIVNLRRNPNFTNSDNEIFMNISTSYNSQTNLIVSNPIQASSLSTTFLGVAFTFASNLQASTFINAAYLTFSRKLSSDQVYLSRSLSQYDGVQIGMATSSQIGFGNTIINFNFLFNKIFNQVSNEIYGAFNYTDPSQFGLAKPNRLREAPPFREIDGYWTYKSEAINKPLSIYPRATLSNSSYVGSSTPQYNYIGYTHDIFVNIGYNSNGVMIEEGPISLFANAKWKTTWMNRAESNFKNFNIFNIAQQTYSNSIYYRIGLANTFIGTGTNPKNAIFEGTFQPTGNLSLAVPVSVGFGTSSGVQVYVNNNTQPIIDTFSVLSSDYTVATGLLTTAQRNDPVYFKILFFTLSTAIIDVNWNVGFGKTLIGIGTGTQVVSPTPYSLNSGAPIDNISFLNVSKTLEDATSVNFGYPPGDSFVIRTS